MIIIERNGRKDEMAYIAVNGEWLLFFTLLWSSPVSLVRQERGRQFHALYPIASYRHLRDIDLVNRYLVTLVVAGVSGGCYGELLSIGGWRRAVAPCSSSICLGKPFQLQTPFQPVDK
jgi:hypothetical protein